MNDLLGSVKPAREKASTSYSASRGRDRAADYDVEAGFASAPGQKEDTDLFFKKVQEIKQDMLEVKTLEREIERMHEESKAIVRTKEMQALRKTMQARWSCRLWVGRRGRSADVALGIVHYWPLVACCCAQHSG